MTLIPISTPLKMTLEEYLNYDDGTDTQYELVNGELIVVPAESEINRRIATLFICLFSSTGHSILSAVDEN